MVKPTIRELMDATGISKAYASVILSGNQAPARALAVHIYRQTGWKPPVIADLSNKEIEAVEKAETAAGALPIIDKAA